MLIMLFVEGIVSTVAGDKGKPFGYKDSVARGALFHHPTAVVVDASFHVFVTDTLNKAIRVIYNG